MLECHRLSEYAESLNVQAWETPAAVLARQSSRPDSLLERGDIIAGLALVLGVLVSLIFETKDFEFASSRTVLEQQPVK